MFLLIFNERVPKITFVLVLTYYVKLHLFVILTSIGWFIVNIQSDLFWHQCLERQADVYALSFEKYKGKQLREISQRQKCIVMYKYVPNLESLLTQQYVCVRCTLWSDNTCVFTRFHSVKNANTQLIWSSAYITEDYTSLCLNIICNRSFFILKWCQLCSVLSFYTRMKRHWGENISVYRMRKLLFTILR